MVGKKWDPEETIKTDCWWGPVLMVASQVGFGSGFVAGFARVDLGSLK